MKKNCTKVSLSRFSLEFFSLLLLCLYHVLCHDTTFSYFKAFRMRWALIKSSLSKKKIYAFFNATLFFDLIWCNSSFHAFKLMTLRLNRFRNCKISILVSSGFKLFEPRVGKTDLSWFEAIKKSKKDKI